MIFFIDQCQTETVDDTVWPESSIGEVVERPCPCEDYLQSGNKARRTCGGSNSLGGQWMEVDYSHCEAVNNEITNTLCKLFMVGYFYLILVIHFNLIE